MVLTITIPSGGSVKSVEYGRPDGSTSPSSTSSAANGTFAATATVCWPSIAGGGDCSANQPGSGTNPSTAGSRAAVTDGAFSDPAVTPSATADTSIAPPTTKPRVGLRFRRSDPTARCRARCVDASSGKGSASRASRSARAKSDDTVLLQNGAELVLRACEPRGDRADRKPEHTGDLLERQVEPVMQHDDDPLAGTEPCNGVRDRPSAEVVLGRLAESPGVKRALVVRDDLQPPTPAEGVDCSVDRDPLQP